MGGLFDAWRLPSRRKPIRRSAVRMRLGLLRTELKNTSQPCPTTLSLLPSASTSPLLRQVNLILTKRAADFTARKKSETVALFQLRSNLIEFGRKRGWSFEETGKCFPFSEKAATLNFVLDTLLDLRPSWITTFWVRRTVAPRRGFVIGGTTFIQQGSDLARHLPSRSLAHCWLTLSGHFQHWSPMDKRAFSSTRLSPTSQSPLASGMKTHAG